MLHHIITDDKSKNKTTNRCKDNSFLNLEIYTKVRWIVNWCQALITVVLNRLLKPFTLSQSEVTELQR